MEMNDFYCMHAFVIKRNKYFLTNRRFMVLTNQFIINVKADFTDKTCTSVKYSSMQWRVPIKCLSNIQFKQDKEYFVVNIFVNLPELNQIMMQQFNAPKEQTKDKRVLKFTDISTFRDFIFHLKRLYHLHNCSRLVDFEHIKERLRVEIKP